MHSVKVSWVYGYLFEILIINTLKLIPQSLLFPSFTPAKASTCLAFSSHKVIIVKSYIDLFYFTAVFSIYFTFLATLVNILFRSLYLRHNFQRVNTCKPRQLFLIAYFIWGFSLLPWGHYSNNLLFDGLWRRIFMLIAESLSVSKRSILIQIALWRGWIFLSIFKLLIGR